MNKILIVICILLIFSTNAQAQKWFELAPIPETIQVAAIANCNGKVYVFGGQAGVGSGQVATTECYNPTTNTWSKLDSMPTARRGASATVVNNLIYIIGGGTGPGSGTLLGTTECYNPTTNTWSKLDSMPIPTVNAFVTNYNNKIYVFGGVGNNGQSTQCYDIETNTWSTLQNLPIEQLSPSGGIINNLIYIIGNESNEYFNPVNNTWTELSSPPSFFEIFNPTYNWNGNCNESAVCNNQIYFFSNNLSCVYTPSTNQYASVTNMPHQRENSSVTCINDKIYVIGGTLGKYGNSGSVLGDTSNEVYVDTSFRYDTTYDTIKHTYDSPYYYDDTSYVEDTTKLNSDTIGINIIIKKEVFVITNFLEYYYLQSLDSCFLTINNNTTQFDTSFIKNIDSIWFKKTVKNNYFIYDSTILYPKFIIRDTVWTKNLIVVKQDTIPDTSIHIFLIDTIGTVIKIIDTQIVPIVIRDTIVQLLESVDISLQQNTNEFYYNNNEFHFESNNNIRELKIYDMLGRCIFLKSIVSGQTNLELMINLSTGTYIATLDNNILKFRK